MIINFNKDKNDKFECIVDFDYDIDIIKFIDQFEAIILNTNYYLIGDTYLYVQVELDK